MTNRLFIYGTLAPGRPNEHILQGIPGSWEEASVKGVLHHEGWGADMGYPGISLDENGATVDGYLFSSDELGEHWQTLDEFEGEEYERVLTEVSLSDNSRVSAYIYSLKSM